MSSDGSEATWWNVLLLIVVAVGSLMSIVFVGGYPMYLADQGNQQACAEEFGSNATYIGDVSGGGQGILCKTESGVETTKGQMAPMNFETVSEYASAFAGGKT